MIDDSFASRREVLKGLGAGLVCGVCSGLLPQVTLAANLQSARAALPKKAKKLNLLCLNTGERFNGEYSSGSSYHRSALREMNKVLRDYRTNAVRDIDRKLYDHLHLVASTFGEDKEIQIICGYRSKQTNEMLRKRTNGVAKDSMHLVGKAVDFRITGVDMRHLKKAALAYSKKINMCGVGAYSRFVHLDTGKCRCW